MKTAYATIKGFEVIADRAVIKAEIPDFRSQIDCVIIDLNYDSKVFDIDFSDLPTKKPDLVAGQYEFDAKDCGKALAVKIIDMREEVQSVRAI